jgi:integrase
VDKASTLSPTLIDLLRCEIRARQMSLRTEVSYVYWVRDFCRERDFGRFLGRWHPREMGPAEVEAYLAILANRRRVAASTHNQALSALLFLYRAAPNAELPWLHNLPRRKRPQRPPAILTVEEATAALSRMQGKYGLLARLPHGTGMRISEALRLRMEDADFDRRTLVDRDGKSEEDRALMLPRSLVEALRTRLGYSRSLWLRIRSDQAASAAAGAGSDHRGPR